MMCIYKGYHYLDNVDTSLLLVDPGNQISFVFADAEWAEATTAVTLFQKPAFFMQVEPPFPLRAAPFGMHGKILTGKLQQQL